jgi:hypothetical protein
MQTRTHLLREVPMNLDPDLCHYAGWGSPQKCTLRLPQFSIQHCIKELLDNTLLIHVFSRGISQAISY